LGGNQLELEVFKIVTGYEDNVFKILFFIL